MEVVVTTGAIGGAKLQSHHYHQQTNAYTPVRVNNAPMHGECLKF